MVESVLRLNSSEASQPTSVAREQGIWQGLDQALEVLEALSERRES
jgi:hypothetical protein